MRFLLLEGGPIIHGGRGEMGCQLFFVEQLRFAGLGHLLDPKPCKLKSGQMAATLAAPARS